jgi:hypothetical protein
VCECVRVRERECVCVRERECVCERERERVCESERERECVCVCVCVFLPYLSGTQIAAFLGSIVLPCVACLAPSYFSTLSQKRHDFRKERLLNIKCVF